MTPTTCHCYRELIRSYLHILRATRLTHCPSSLCFRSPEVCCSCVQLATKNSFPRCRWPTYQPSRFAPCAEMRWRHTLAIGVRSGAWRSVVAVHNFSRELQENLQRQTQRNEQICSWILNNQIVLFAQAIHPLQGNSAAHEIDLEVLCRLRDDEGKLISPIDFLQVANQAGSLRSLIGKSSLPFLTGSNDDLMRWH